MPITLKVNTCENSHISIRRPNLIIIPDVLSSSPLQAIIIPLVPNNSNPNRQNQKIYPHFTLACQLWIFYLIYCIYILYCIYIYIVYYPSFYSTPFGDVPCLCVLKQSFTMIFRYCHDSLYTFKRRLLRILATETTACSMT